MSGVMPWRLKARARLRPCQSRPSPNMTMAASFAPGALMALSEGSGQDGRVDVAGLEAFAGLERGHRHLRRAEQHAVDCVEIAFDRREDVGERLAVILGFDAWQTLGKPLCVMRAARHEELRAAAIDDGIVGASHGGNETGRGRRQRRRGDAVDDFVERKVQLMRLVQRYLQAPRRDLYRPGEARGWRIDEGEVLRLELAGLRHLLDERRRRGTISFEHEHSAWRLVAIAELVEQLLRRADGAGRTRAEHAVFLALAVLGREAPSGILRAEASEHRLRRVHRHHERPGVVGVRSRERHAAEAAETNLGDPPSGLKPPHGIDAAIDPALAERSLAHIDAKRAGISDERFDEGLRLGVDARPGSYGASLWRLSFRVVHPHLPC